MITDTLDGARNGHDVNRGRDRTGVFHHVRDQLANDGLEFDIDLDVGTDDVERQRTVHAGESIERLMHHAQRRFGQMADADAVLLGQGAGLVDAAHTLGNFLGFVAATLKVGDDLADPQYQAQIGGDGLAPGDDVGAIVIDGLLEIVDLSIRVDNRPHPVDLTAYAGFDRRRDLGFDQPPHVQHMGAQAGEILIELC